MAREDAMSELGAVTAEAVDKMYKERECPYCGKTAPRTKFGIWTCYYLCNHCGRGFPKAGPGKHAGMPLYILYKIFGGAG